MDIADDYFDVEHRAADTSLKRYACQTLENWLTASIEQNSVFLGNYPHTERDAMAWLQAANEFEKLADAVNEESVYNLRKKPTRYDSTNYRFNTLASLTPKERSQSDVKLLRGLLELVISTVSDRGDQHESEALAFFVCQGALVQLNRFADLYEFSLQHAFDKNFIRTALKNLSRSMRILPNLQFDTISDCVPSKDLPANSCLYFAYGSNMDHQQMQRRTPGAKFAGLADLHNFEYYIDARGVASVMPKIGSNVKGMLWDIQDNEDWASLDRYEGVAGGYYNRIEAKVMQGKNLQNATIYISTNTSFGTPRPGYQENIIRSVIEQSKRCDITEENFYKEAKSRESYGEIFGGSHNEAFLRWAKELDSWLKN